MNRTATLSLAVLAAATVAAPAALAAPKPITKTYEATAPMPDPTNYAQQGYSVCAQNVPQSFHTETFKVPAAGSLKVELTGYQGDWDLLLVGDKGQELATGGATDLGTPEVVQVKFKKATTVGIVACNWAGGPTGTVTYTFTFK
jgi:hypothetical protein